ncbi:MAG: hypothetical protein U0326_44285 [Polyangiales bacterium]
MELDAEAVYRTYLESYVEAVGGGRLDGVMALRETTEPERAAIALAAFHASKHQQPSTKVAVVKELREMLKAPAVAVAPAAPPTPEG